jgi:hypothetical protein
MQLAPIPVLRYNGTGGTEGLGAMPLSSMRAPAKLFLVPKQPARHMDIQVQLSDGHPA